MMPLPNTVIISMIIKICGRASASRLHKIIYILKEKYRVPLKLRYESSLSIYSDDLEYDVQIVSRGEYVDRIYRVTERGLRTFSRMKMLRECLISLNHILESWEKYLSKSL